MHCVNNTLFLFTAQFPYGKVSETFLETEIIFLAKKFETIHIFPASTDDYCRKIPENVLVNTDYSNLTFSKSQKIKALFFYLPLTYSALFSEVKDKGFFRCLRNKSVLLDYLANQLLFKSYIEKKVVEDVKNTVCYDYWFCNKTLALTLIKKKNKQLKFVARAHGFDLYDERWSSGVPYRKFKAKYIDKIYFISQNGYDYFREKVATSIERKMRLSYLGVLSNEVLPLPKNEIPVIVSVSRVVSFKNVHQIPALLAQLNFPIKWVHFGDGEDMERVKIACEKYLKEGCFELKGHISNQEMIAFLQNHKVDLLLSLSSSEGLPVSMMEAQSFGVPILSTAVGGIPEIVVDGKTGFLIYDEKETLDKLKRALDYSFSKQEIQDFFNTHFNANINYANFAESLCCLEN